MVSTAAIIITILLLIFGGITAFGMERGLLYVFMCLYAIVPEYLALEVSASLPLLTAARILILLLLAYTLRIHQGVLRVEVRNMQKQHLNIVFFYYFFLVGTALLVNLPSATSYVIKRMFVLAFEEFLVLWILITLITNKKIFDRCLSAFLYGGVGICFVGIVQSLTNINLAYYLNTVQRTMLQSSYVRLGFTRAEASFGHPVYFAQFCVLIMPLISFMADKTKQKRWLFFLCIDLLALVCSNSRGAMLIGVVILVVDVLRKRRKFQIKYFAGCVVGILALGAVIFFVPSIGSKFLSIIQSVLNVFGFSFAIENYGENVSGLGSRVAQLTGLTWTYMNDKMLFGFGPDAHIRGLVSYVYDGRWQSLATIDIGYVGFIMCEGIVGAFGECVLIFGLLYKSLKWSNWRDDDNLNNAFLLCFLAYAMLLTVSTGLEPAFWILISLFITYNMVSK